MVTEFGDTVLMAYDVETIEIQGFAVNSIDAEFIREFEKIASTVVPKKDWFQRIAVIKRFESLVIGGAVDYLSFWGLLKQLVGPLSTQFSDRRSRIVKQ
ncbi:CLIP-associated protein, partial [Bienertia sinuspersici]